MMNNEHEGTNWKTVAKWFAGGAALGTAAEVLDDPKDRSVPAGIIGGGLAGVSAYIVKRWWTRWRRGA